MLAHAAALARNLSAGARLALFLPVRRLAFRVGVGPLLALFAASALVDIGADAIRYGDDAVFSWYGLGNEVFSGGLLMVTAAVLSLLYRDRALALSLPVIALSAFPILQILHALPWPRMGVPAVPAGWLDTAILAWAVALLVRAVAIALEYRRTHRALRAIAGGLLLAAPIFVAPAIAPVDPWFAPPAADRADPRFPNPASEPVMAAQSRLLDDALAALDDERPGVVDLYFVGFAADSTEDVFRKDVLAAQRVMDERWGTRDRSVALVNSVHTLLTDPIATLTHLREALAEIAAAMNVDEDVAMVYIAGHGDPGSGVAVRLPPLDLVPIGPAALRRAFDEAGIRHRIVVVSACYSGSFVDALADDDTAVIVAARSDRASFGCGHGSDATWFGDAFFREGMGRAPGLAEAFDIAREVVAAKEQREGRITSEPQIRVGERMAAKLKSLARRGGEAQQEAARAPSPAGV
jgi:hypothetical protein